MRVVEGRLGVWGGEGWEVPCSASHWFRVPVCTSVGRAELRGGTLTPSAAPTSLAATTCSLLYSAVASEPDAAAPDAAAGQELPILTPPGGDAAAAALRQGALRCSSLPSATALGPPAPTPKPHPGASTHALPAPPAQLPPMPAACPSPGCPASSPLCTAASWSPTASSSAGCPSARRAAGKCGGAALPLVSTGPPLGKTNAGRALAVCQLITLPPCHVIWCRWMKASGNSVQTPREAARLLPPPQASQATTRRRPPAAPSRRRAPAATAPSSSPPPASSASCR